MSYDIMEVNTNYEILKQRMTVLKRATEETLVNGLDYGNAFGGSDKPTLLKPGAEKLSFLFGLRPTFEIVDKTEDWDAGLFYYRYRCTLHDRAGEVLADSEGSCNSREVKYRYRNAKPKCPQCGAEAISRSKYPPRGSAPGTPSGWWCRECKADFALNDKAITEQESGKVENPEPFDLVNTLQKMAQKRALVAAVLVATGASQFFTQDVEDMAEFTPPTTVVTEVKPASKPQAPPAPASDDGPDFEDGSEEAPPRPYAPADLRGIIRDSIIKVRAKNYSLGDKRDNFRFAVVANLEACFEQHKDQGRHLVTEYLTGKASSKDLDDAEIKVLHKWLDAHPIDGGEWVVNQFSQQEARTVARQALEDAGQGTLFDDNSDDLVIELPVYSEMGVKELQDHVSAVLMPLIREKGLSIEGYKGAKPSVDWLANVWAALQIAPTLKI